MLKVYICEDNKEHKENIRKIVENTIVIEDYDMEVELVTDNPFEIIKSIEENGGTGVYFLDVDLKCEINGIQLAEKIREIDPQGFIIFVTTHAEMSYLTFMYKIEAMDYIIKDNYKNIRERIKDCIEHVNLKYSSKVNSTEVFSITVDDKMINLPYNEILFFETSTTIHRIIVRCVDRQIEFYGRMKELEEKLKQYDFCRCHTSFLVNKKNIKEIDKKNRIAYMINGDECLISTRGVKSLVE